MSLKHSRVLSIGGKSALAGVLMAALAVQTQAANSVLDNFEAGTSQNLFLGYSYYYADGKDGGTSKVLSSAPGATANELILDSAKSFDLGANASKKSLKLDFTMGANKPSCGAACTYGQMVGFGTQFIAGTDDATAPKALDITGATAISFYAKGSVAMKVRVEITTKGVTDYAFHRGEVTLTTDWAKYTVNLTSGLGGINQPSWTTTPVPFDFKTVQKLQYQISMEDNTTLTAGTMWLDDIVVEGYSWLPPSACAADCFPATPPAGALLGDLEPDATKTPAVPGTQNRAGGFWFVYNDVGSRAVTLQSEFSEIFEGVTVTDIKVPIFKVSPAKGNAASNGAYIKFTLGPSFPENGSVIQPFVGIGTKTSNELETSSLDLTGSTGLVFDYNTDVGSTFPFVRLEVKSNQTDLGTNKGAVHHILLPATAGAWKTASIPWSKLVLPDWQDIPNKAAALKISGILKFQWAVQNAPGTTGGFAIDNVKVAGLTVMPVVGIRNAAGRAAKGLQLQQAAGRLDVAFDMPAGLREAEIRLLDLKGAVVLSRAVVGNGQLKASLDTRALRNGLYSLQVKQGGLVRGAAVTILR
jgi:hypothetical protein